MPPAPIDVEPEPIPIKPIKPEPIEVIEPKPIPQKPIEAIIPTPSYGGGGGGGYFYGAGYEDGRGGLGREQYLAEASQRENLQ